MPARSKRSLASSRNIRRKFLKAGPMREYDSVEPSWKMTTENVEDMDSDVELAEYAFDSELVQTMNALAMLRYDKEGEKKLKGQAKRCGGSGEQFSAYQAKTAQVDTQAILRGVHETGVTLFSSVVNGSIPGTPIFLSAAGLHVVASSPAMIEAHNCLQAALQELLKEFPNVASAKSASSPLYETYRQAQRTKMNLQNAMNKIQFAVVEDLLEQENMNTTAEWTGPISTWSYEEEADALQVYQAEHSHNPIPTTTDVYIDPRILESKMAPMIPVAKSM
ncbi:hypothetical protein V1520DRAFT_310727 [Lipomyces starkeyi]|uniref:Uncharacterized protein n=1 Tax=Lipomyces starkeyi NRRL Y-11557 TaxID=675824 RepID=A0A1E3PX39_LIPST|nr:hypothetical protein LIPSTDRAFT_6623 [Lipomyces starkeyi NRRL Y-11557]